MPDSVSSSPDQGELFNRQTRAGSALVLDTKLPNILSKYGYFCSIYLANCLAESHSVSPPATLHGPDRLRPVAPAMPRGVCACNTATSVLAWQRPLLPCQYTGVTMRRSVPLNPHCKGGKNHAPTFTSPQTLPGLIETPPLPFSVFALPGPRPAISVFFLSDLEFSWATAFSIWPPASP